MIWTIIHDDSNLQIETNFADGVFKQEKPTLRIKSKMSDDVLLYIDGVLIATYTPDAYKNIYIDLTDYFSTLNIGTTGVNSIQVSTNQSQKISVEYNVRGLRDPQYMDIPDAFTAVRFSLRNMSQEISIAPPTRWLEPLFGLNDSIVIYRYEISSYLVRLLFGLSVFDISSQVLNNIEVPASANAVILHLLRSNNILVEKRLYNRQTLLCGRKYAAVEWVSRSGMIKRHTWEVRDVKDKSTDRVELMTHFNGYREEKGYETTIVLHLDNLTQYDYWYYSDIITSSDVRVALNEVDADFGEDTRVQVLTNSNAQPNAHGLYELNVEIKFKHYGRV